MAPIGRLLQFLAPCLFGMLLLVGSSSWLFPSAQTFSESTPTLNITIRKPTLRSPPVKHAAPAPANPSKSSFDMHDNSGRSVKRAGAEKNSQATTREPRATREVFDYPASKRCTEHPNRDFHKHPILVLDSGFPMGKEFHSLKCDVPCLYSSDFARYAHTADVSKIFSVPQLKCPHQHAVLFTMENVEISTMSFERTYIMNVSLRSHVPVPYYSWSDFPLLAPPAEKPTHIKKLALATAFVSNCVPERRELIQSLIDEGVGVDSFGPCVHTKNEVDVSRVNGKYSRKMDIMSKYLFHLAFENSKAEDYVSEKYFQALAAGTVPVVYGAPNIREYQPSNNSILVAAEFASPALLAKRMKEIAADPEAYEAILAWKRSGPSDAFKATIDFATVHSECRLCIKAADDYAHAHGHLDEGIDPSLPPSLRVPLDVSTPLSDSLAVPLRLLVRERHRFYFRPIYLSTLTYESLSTAIHNAFKATSHIPAYARRRHFDGVLRVFSVYHAYVTARQAREEARVMNDDHVAALANNTRLEVVFV
eukprot:m.203599 g.203599  ORF g.203599 m.203599 type:complete len:535 (-) comp15520_c3_seq1:27-1631(-)